jgi:hypothetical protein
MNHILHNISLIILGFGLILLVVYITKASSNGFQTTDVINMQNNNLRQRPSGDTIYDYKVSKEYKKMFVEPSIWQGYQTFDPNNIPQKIYIK